ncbi:MAG: response regulator [Spirochaetaceae bacterium]|nr:response regulator [Spirochaetaceae bacterium]
MMRMNKTLKIVLADDEEVIRDTLAKKINSSSSGYSVVAVAESGREALEKIRSLKPDILLTDICMPGMDGLELVKEAAAAEGSLKTVIISGYDNFSYAKTAMSLGIRDYILKPFSQDELFSVLDKIASEIEAARKQRQRAEADLAPVFYTPGLLKKYQRNGPPRPGDLEERLLVLIERGDAERALEIFDSLLGSYSALMQKGHDTLVFMMLVELILNISNMITQSGDEVEKGGTETLLDKLKKNFSKDGLADISGSMREYIAGSCNTVNLSYKNRGRKIVNTLKDLIEKNLGDENFCLEKAAKKIHFSASYIRQLFRRITGESFTEYLIRRRMETAGKLILIPEYRILDVAEYSGYSNQRYFSSCFKKYYHCTPSEYRERMRKSPVPG